MSKKRYYVTNQLRFRHVKNVGLVCPEESLVDSTYKPKHLGELVKLMETDGYSPKRISRINLENGLPGPVKCAADFAEQMRMVESAKADLKLRIEKIEESERILRESQQQKPE